MRYIPLALVTTLAIAGTANAAEIELWRLDCGRIEIRNQDLFSDSFAYSGGARMLTNSCYLIRHDSDYMLWDTGLPGAMAGQPPNTDPAAAFVPSLDRTLTSQLGNLGITPDMVTRVGISHGHFDHTGQAADFAPATLLIGAGDLTAMQSTPLPFAFDPASLDPWLNGDAPVEAVTGDRDIFGDGSVIMMAMPGHTAGETALLVRLAEAGPVLLSGDVVHFQEQLQNRAVPVINTDRADSLASIARLIETAENLGAQLVIQHEPQDVGRLAAFPDSTR
ncbi:MAG: N-acyl homoserine lactonase family protein [Albidovulum sp.]|uniref:N-acyl homoserine lactonase family protein n=1 Tax=Albidovulum sp. TaxID=1872424 RepID=UPI003CA5B28A